MLVGVLKENPNQNFYKRLGARLLTESPFDWEGYATLELKYVWDDLYSFLDKA
jgi:hypothetical protein